MPNMEGQEGRTMDRLFRCLLCALLLLAFALPAAAAPSVERMIGAMIMVGFRGQIGRAHV